MTIAATPASPPSASHRLCFAPLAHGGRSFDFPCDADGHVDIDHLSERSRLDYFFARALVGRACARPAVRRG